MQRQILLATDLSARCDRAFDRAVFLARLWNARLTIVAALEDWSDDALYGTLPSWRRADSELDDAENQIRDDLRGKDVDADIFVRRTRASELIVDVARAARHDLIVTGIARSTGLVRAILGATVEAILRERVAPVLVVKRRVRESYRSVLVGIDFSAGSRAALQTTLELFPQAALAVLHAYDEISVPLSTKMESGEAAYRQACDECTRFVAQTLPAPPGGVRCLAEAGFPETLLNQYAIDNGVDLISVGTHGRNLLNNLLFGSTCSALILSSPCDLVLVSSDQMAAR